MSSSSLLLPAPAPLLYVEHFWNAFFKENTLLAEAFVKDGGISVEAYLKSAGDVVVTEFKRVALG